MSIISIFLQPKMFYKIVKRTVLIASCFFAKCFLNIFITIALKVVYIKRNNLISPAGVVCVLVWIDPWWWWGEVWPMHWYSWHWWWQYNWTLLSIINHINWKHLIDYLSRSNGWICLYKLSDLFRFISLLCISWIEMVDLSWPHLVILLDQQYKLWNKSRN